MKLTLMIVLILYRLACSVAMNIISIITTAATVIFTEVICKKELFEDIQGIGKQRQHFRSRSSRTNQSFLMPSNGCTMIAYGATAALIICSLFIKANCKQFFELETEYNKDVPPSKGMEIGLSLFINRVSAVEESKEEISLDVFLQMYWQDPRIRIIENKTDLHEVTWSKEVNMLWVPDLYIKQLREMKILSVLQDLTTIRLYKNSTLRMSMGATIILKCDMDFQLYPLDVQTCVADFSSFKFTSNYMKFYWRGAAPLTFPNDFEAGCRLPKYVVSFEAQPGTETIYYGEGSHSAARLVITLRRELRSHLFESYLPSTLFVIMSWGSFVIMPEVVPGRMVLLVTTLLSLVTMFDTVRNNSPNSLQLKCIEVWIISCTVFVFLALMEYFIVLFGIRFEKHWRNLKKAERTIAVNGNQRIVPMDDNSIGQHKDADPTLPINPNATDLEPQRNAKLKLRLIADHIILYCGSQRGNLDRLSLTLFPLCFLIFAIFYWCYYLSEVHRASFPIIMLRNIP